CRRGEGACSAGEPGVTAVRGPPTSLICRKVYRVWAQHSNTPALIVTALDLQQKPPSGDPPLCSPGNRDQRDTHGGLRRQALVLLRCLWGGGHLSKVEDSLMPPCGQGDTDFMSLPATLVVAGGARGRGWQEEEPARSVKLFILDLLLDNVNHPGPNLAHLLLGLTGPGGGAVGSGKGAVSHPGYTSVVGP
ncbi:unnamed protein product, partial [Discosporangium mesarthrocarpum]